MDLATPQPKLMVQTDTVRRKTCVAEAVQHVLEQGGKPRAVQPIATEPSVGSKGGVGVVVHLSKNKRETNQHFIHRTETTIQNFKINHDDNKILTQILSLTDGDLLKLYGMKLVPNQEKCTI
jgi:hypothetical protein